MPSLLEKFHALPAELRKQVQLDLCAQALRVWQSYCHSQGIMKYVETVCDTQQTVDSKLPEDAFRSVMEGKDSRKAQARYGEPICAMQDDDLELPDDLELAYYSIHNLFRKYVLDDPINDGLIANQALSAYSGGAEAATILESAMARLGH
jgi:hypothetical protein